MEAQTGMIFTSPTGSSYLPIVEDFNSIIRRPYLTKVPQLTDMIPESLNKSCSLETEAVGEVPEKVESLYRETIREWWIGRVLKVYPEERYFKAHLNDLKGNESIAEFNIDTALEDSSDVEYYLFPGAEFAFFVVTRHGRGSPETISRLEFTSPYIWKEEDNKKVKELYRELFPDDTPLED